MNPLVGQVAFSMGLTIFLLALVILPFLDRTSPEFVADVMALLISGLFTVVIALWTRRRARLPIDPQSTPVERADTEDDLGK